MSRSVVLEHATASHPWLTPLLLVCGVLVVVAGWVYVRGLLVLWRHPQGRRRQRWRPALVAVAVVLLLVVDLPPLGEYLEERLSTHMVQHVVMITVVAPLLAVAAPGQPFLAGLPVRFRRRLARLVHRVPVTTLLAPHVAWALQITALWAWHLPVAYDAALHSETVHLIEHACFLLTAWLFWWHLATLGRRRLRGFAALLYVVAAIPPGAALGAVLTFSDRPLYPTQAAHAAASGISPLLDQRIGGLVMWIPLDFAYLGLAVLLLARFWRRMDATWVPDLMHGAPPDVVDAVADPVTGAGR